MVGRAREAGSGAGARLTSEGLPRGGPASNEPGHVERGAASSGRADVMVTCVEYSKSLSGPPGQYTQMLPGDDEAQGLGARALGFEGLGVGAAPLEAIGAAAAVHTDVAWGRLGLASLGSRARDATCEIRGIQGLQRGS